MHIASDWVALKNCFQHVGTRRLWTTRLTSQVTSFAQCVPLGPATLNFLLDSVVLCVICQAF